MAYSTTTLTGTYTLFDGTPAQGVIEIIPSEKVVKDTTGDVILSGRVKVTLDAAGKFSVDLPSTDDVTLNPTGFGYTLVAKLHHQHIAAVSFSLPAGSPVDIEDVTPVDPSTFTPDATYVQTGELAIVATTGAYTDLTDKPVIPTTAADVGALADTTTLPDLPGKATDAQLPDRLQTSALAGTYARRFPVTPGSSDGQRRWVKLLTIDGVTAADGGYANFILSGSGDFGGSRRGTVLVHAAQRGTDTINVDAWSWGVEETLDPLEVYTVQISSFKFELWIRAADWNQEHDIHLLASNNATIAPTAGTSTAPAGAVSWPRKRMATNAAPIDVGNRAGTFDAERSVYLPTPTALDGVRAKIAAGASGASRTKIAWVGTSIPLGYGSTIGVTSPPVLLRKYLERRYGVSGTGLVPANTGVHLGSPIATADDARYTLSGTWNATGGPRVNNMLLHLASGTTGDVATFTSDVAGTAVEIYYFNNSRPFTYSIDGGTAVTVTPGGTNAIAVKTITGLSDAKHTVAVTVAGTSGTCYLLGVNVRQAAGVVVSGFGYYGSISADWLPTAVNSAFYNGHAAVSGYAPDVVMVQLGPNELIHGISGGAATVKTNLTTIVAAHQSAGRQVVLVVDPPIESGTVSGWATAYRSAIYDVADAKGVPLIDLTDAWRNRAQGDSLGYYADQWHPTPAGSAAMAETVFAALAR